MKHDGIARRDYLYARRRANRRRVNKRGTSVFLLCLLARVPTMNQPRRYAASRLIVGSFVSRIKDNGTRESERRRRRRSRIVDRICPISTNRALSIGQALCHRCVGIPVREASTPVGNSTATRGSGDGPADPGACAGCGNQLQEGQALVALDRQWHVWCFKCHSCDTVLHGEYMGK